MINLLPYDLKKQTKAARMNVILLRYIVIIIASAIFLVLACAVTYYYLNADKTSANKPANNNTNSSIQDQSNSFRTNLATTKNILDQQISYSDALTGIGAVLPVGAVLDTLTLTDSSFGTTLNLQINAKTANIETKLKENIKNSALFSNYSYQSTTTNSNGQSEYPFTINISVTINKSPTK